MQRVKLWSSTLGIWIKKPTTLFFFTLSGCFFCLGLIIGGLGPIVLELGRRNHVPVESVGLFVSARGVGYVLGGSMMDCGVPGNVMLAVSVVGAALSTCIITLAYTFWGVAMGMLDSGGNVQLLWLFKDTNVNPYMQCLHFFFAVGSTVSPLVVGRVMDEFNNNFNYAYYALGAAFIPFILCLFLQPPAKKPEEEEPENMAGEMSEGRRVGLTLFNMFCHFTGDQRWMIGLVSIFLGIYVGAEVGTGSLIYTYVVKREIGTESQGYMMTFVFWALISVGRLAAVPLSLVLSGFWMLLINLIGCITAPVVILIFPDSLPVLWGAIGFYGFFMASSFPTAFVVAESMMTISGSIASLFVVGSGLGEILIPMIITELFATRLSYFSLIYAMLACSLMGLLSWLGMVWRYKSMEKRGVLPYQIAQLQDGNIYSEGKGEDSALMDTSVPNYGHKN